VIGWTGAEVADPTAGRHDVAPGRPRGDPSASSAPLRREGWRVVPIPPGEKYPKNLANWQDKATVDIDVIERWWPDGSCNGIGIATGAGTGMFVLDVDPAHGGDDTLADLEHEHGRLPDTIEVLTGGGGRHIYFALPDGVTITNDQSGRLGPGLDIRGEGGQVVAPPTVHASRTSLRMGRPSPARSTAPTSPTHLPGSSSCSSSTPRTGRTPTDTQRAHQTRHGPPRGPVRNRHPMGRPALWRRLDTALATAHGRQGDYRTVDTPRQAPTQPGQRIADDGGTDLLKVFTSNAAPLQADATYTRFGYYTATRHGGDHRAAARALAATQPSTPNNVNVETGEIETDWRNLPSEFWIARPELAHIRQAAHSRSRCADSVLVATLARVAALVPHTVVLPPIVGSVASLNFFAAMVARSGGGNRPRRTSPASSCPSNAKTCSPTCHPDRVKGSSKCSSSGSKKPAATARNAR